MKIAVNTRLLLKNKLEGIGWFTYESLKRMTQNHPEHEFIFIFDRKYDEEFIFSDNVKGLAVPPQARHPVLYFLWFQFSIPYILKKHKVDVFLSPDGYIPLWSKTPSISVMHDLNYEHYPEDLPFAERKNYRYFFPKFARRADRMATVSEFSKNDICQQYGVPAEKIDVVYNGASDIFQPVPEEVKTETREKFSGGNPYFMFVGALHPRKNLVNLFRAFDQFKKGDKRNVKLLIVGASKWWTKEIKETYDNMVFKAEVIFTGRVSSEDLNKLLSSSVALTYVSYFEGFGIPILEAYRAETSVITSNITSMPEVAKDGALLVDPFNIDEIADAMKDMSEKPELRNSLIENGRKRKNDFSWEATAEKLWACVENVIEKKLK